MGKRYYCDYCDRSFKDDPESRKKHINSLQHINQRAEHYSQFKDPEDILRVESGKIPCKNLMTHGDCMFGNTCRFSHYTPPMMWELQRIVAWKKWKQDQEQCSELPDTDEIIREYFENPFINDQTNSSGYSAWTISPELKNFPILPPSLWPVTPENIITTSNFTEWG